MILSITGADTQTPIFELNSFHNKNSHVELGLLYYPEKEGTPRNPTLDWRVRFFNMIDKYHIALHLCGENIFRTILSPNFEQSAELQEFKKANRIQININARKEIFTHEEIHAVYSKLLNLGCRLILQYNETSKSWVLPFLASNLDSHYNIDILLDSSLGKGIIATEFYIPEELKQYSFKYGFAGGICIENIEEIHNKVRLLGVDYWLDLESGARTNNVFDIMKAYQLSLLVNSANNPLVNASAYFSNLFSNSITPPNEFIVLPLKQDSLESDLKRSFSPDDIWGSTCRGGFAYFGKTKDILNILDQSKNYLTKSIHTNFEYNKAIFFWNKNEYSLLTLFDDYSNDSLNPLPSQENVLKVEFGAWSSDYSLPEILKEALSNNKEEEDNSAVTDWITVGEETFDNKLHQKMLQKLFKSLKSIDSNITD